MEEIAESYERIAQTLELDEIILAGVAAVYDDDADRWRALLAVAEMLEKVGLKASASYIRRYVRETHRAECRRAGVCPYCGEDVTVQKTVEHHEANRLGSAPERGIQYVCAICGEV